jgi:uncharacterized protein involved in outer membrane biogenesis
MKHSARIKRYLKRTGIGIAVAILLYTLIGFLVLPPVLKSILKSKLSSTLHREVTIQDIKFNPYKLTMAVTGVVIKDRDNSKRFFSFDRFYVDVQWASVFKLALITRELRLEGPYVHIVRKDATTYNFSDLAGDNEPKTTKKTAAAPPKFSLNNIQISNGQVEFSDLPMKKVHKVTGINLTIPFLSALPYDVDIFVQPSFEATFNKTPVSFRGKTRPFKDSIESYLNVDVQDVNLPYYFSYVPFKPNFKLASGYLQTKVKVSFFRKKKEVPALTVDGTVSLTKVVLEDADNASLLNLPRLDISIAPSKPLLRDLHLSKILLSSPEIHLSRLKSGQLNIQTLIPSQNGKQTPANTEKGEALSLKVDEIRLESGKVFLIDRFLDNPFKTSLDPFDLTVTRFTTEPGKRASYQLSFRTESKEMLNLAGELSITPLAVKGKVGIKEVPLKKYLPYYQDLIRFDITDAVLDLHTDYTYAQGQKSPQIGLSHLEIALRDIRLSRPAEKDGFLSLSRFAVEDTQVDLSNRELVIGNLQVHKGKVLVQRDKDGVINLATLLPSTPPEAKDDSSKKAVAEEKPFAITLKQISVKDLGVVFEDRMPQQTVKAALNRITLNAKNISTKKGEPAKISLALKDIQLTQQGKKRALVSVAQFAVEEAQIDLSKRELVIRDIQAHKGSVLIKRDKDGVINLATLFPSKPPEGKDAEPQKTVQKDPQKEKPFGITLEQISVKDFGVVFEDRVPQPMVKATLDRITLNGKNVATKKGEPAKISLSFDLNKKGRFSLSGDLGINPLAAELKLNAKDLPIRPFQPYFTDKIKIEVRDGRIAMSGDISAGHSQEKGLQGKYHGQVSLSNLATVDKRKGDDLLFMEALHLKGVDVAYGPAIAKIQEIALDSFYTKIVLDPDGALNVQKLMPEAEKQEKAPPPPKAPKKGSKKPEEKAPAPSVHIGKVVLRQGHILFQDKTVRPTYSTSLFQLNGEVFPLTPKKGKPINVAIKGKLDKHGPLEITGKIGPDSKDLFLDLLVKLKALDLSPFTPYSGKYVGHTIQKGKLYLDLKYHIEGKKLSAQNKILIDQFTFGNEVESPQATTLPVGFALTLLKDHKGQINLDLPVTGNLDDPKFSLGGIILKAIKNLIVKAAKSPFALIGAMVGSKEELSYVEFEAGRSDLTAENAKKLETLINALAERPALKLDISAHVDRERDKEGLRRKRFNEKIRVQKQKQMAKKGQSAASADQVSVAPDEYERYLKLAYKAEKFKKPKNRLGLAKALPRAEMEKLMLSNIKVTDDDLRLLLYHRAKAVKGHILASKTIEPGRIFIIEPKSLFPEKKPNVKDSRVEFKIK